MYFFRLITIIFVLMLSGCYFKDDQPIEWSPDTSRLNALADDNPQLEVVVSLIKEHMELLRQKKFAQAYEHRTSEFKKLIDQESYIRILDSNSEWQFLDYDILSVEVLDQGTLRLILKVVEFPGPITSHTIVVWKKEGNVWNCSADGPQLLPMFRDLSMSSQQIR